MIRKRSMRMKSMVCKIARAITAIAICWFTAYGIGTAANHCCSPVISICSPSSVRSPLMPVSDVHCQTSPTYFSKSHRPAGEGAGLIWHDSNGPTTCCPAPHCAPIGFTAHPGQSPPYSSWLRESFNSVISDSDHSSIVFSHIRNAHNHSTIPIFLLTKSIIC